MPADFIPSAQDLMRLLPEIVLAVAGTIGLVLEPLLRDSRKRIVGVFSLGGLMVALWAVAVSNAHAGTAFHNMLVVDGFTTFFRTLVIVVGILTVILSLHYIERERPGSGEFYPLLVFSVAGQCLMAAGNELIIIFIGLEISSIASYILAGYLRDDPRSNESGLKYFLLGSFATAFFLYGVAWIYGATGTTNLREIGGIVAKPEVQLPLVIIGTSAALMLVGLAFKVAAAPFQIWAADVYQGAPAPVTAFLAAGPKAAAFAVMVRVFMTAFDAAGSAWEPVLWIVALATMTIGNFAALVQDNIKRLLAYSSIAHAGYVLVAVTAHSDAGSAAVMFYLAAYALMNVGAFAVVTHVARAGERRLSLNDFAGLARSEPVVAGLFTVFLLSLIGIPLTGGFFGKFYIFKAALESQLYLLTVLGLLNSAVAAYYYLRVLVVMYFHEPAAEAVEAEPVTPGVNFVLWFSAGATLLLGIFPTLVLQFADQGAKLSLLR